jgi:LmbE family N-acetylglucosaminyl deacetylase
LIPAGAKKGLAIFAHPDDESLWCGGLLSGELDWTVVCCTIPVKDPIRADKFFAACRSLNVDARLVSFLENGGRMPLDKIDTTGFDVILTHGRAGEYGHPQHTEVHAYVASRFPERARYIGYRRGGSGRFVYPLNEWQRARKLAALKCYDHVSPTDGKPKWEALLERYGKDFDLWCETYD